MATFTVMGLARPSAGVAAARPASHRAQNIAAPTNTTALMLTPPGPGRLSGQRCSAAATFTHYCVLYR